MRRFIIITWILFVYMNVANGQLKNSKDSLSYAIGMDIAKSFKTNEIDLNQKAFIEGFEAMLNTSEHTLIDPNRITEVISTEMRRLQEEKQQKVEADIKVFFDKNKSENSKIIETEEGIQYEILEEGTGEYPKIDETVKVNYIGRLQDGSEFDNSYKRGQPLELALNNVIKGWQIGLPLMREGSKYRLFIPPSLGYGTRNNGTIPPNSILIFDIELMQIVKPDTDEI